MSRLLIAAMPGNVTPATRLAAVLNSEVFEIDVHRFPDGESRVRAPRSAPTAVLYCSLNDPNAKLIELALAAAALRDQGAGRLILVAPYLCYMRQDAAFTRGEAVSQSVVGAFLAERFDRIITVEPHLHRTSSLAEVFIGTPATGLSVAPLLADLIRHDGGLDRAVIVGPDSESRPWTEAVASKIGVPFTVLQKVRRSDREVAVAIDANGKVDGRVAYLVDDIASTGSTLAVAAKELLKRGAVHVEAVVVHALCGDKDLALMTSAGVARFRSTDTVAHSSNAIEIAPLLAGALREEAR